MVHVHGQPQWPSIHARIRLVLHGTVLWTYKVFGGIPLGVINFQRPVSHWMDSRKVRGCPWNRIVVMNDTPHGRRNALLFGGSLEIVDKFFVSDARFSKGPRCVDLVSHGRSQVKGGECGNGSAQRMARQGQSGAIEFLDGPVYIFAKFVVGFCETIMGHAALAPIGTGQFVQGPWAKHGQKIGIPVGTIERAAEGYHTFGIVCCLVDARCSIHCDVGSRLYRLCGHLGNIPLNLESFALGNVSNGIGSHDRCLFAHFSTGP
mmetsp:Transcript_19750/g.40665  ORF Transcript_19750/g.40665 Transcript_19750/m.40665 type:complete len:262 (+) Transcript_19750:145-930(+)